MHHHQHVALPAASSIGRATLLHQRLDTKLVVIDARFRLTVLEIISRGTAAQLASFTFEPLPEVLGHR